MDTMRKKALWTGGLAACVLAVAIAVQASDSKRRPTVRDVGFEEEVILLDDVNPARLEPVPEHYTVRTRYPDGDHRNNNVLAGEPLPECGGESKEIYSSRLGQVLFRPTAGRLVADDLITELVRPCSLCSFRVRVTGGVDDGDDEFIAEVSLYDGCPQAGGMLIPDTRTRFSGLEDDIGIFHDLVLNFGDRGVCADGARCTVSQQDCAGGQCEDGSPCDLADPDCADESACIPDVCEPDPLEIPTEFWARIRFNTSNAAIVVGTPPTRGFSADGYDDPMGNCRSFFNGFPTFAHATFYTDVFAPPECETHFLAYLAANPTAPAFLPNASLPGGQATTQLADDIRLTVPSCTLSAYEVGVKGTNGDFILTTDVRWPDLVNVVEGTQGAFAGRGLFGSLEVAHTTIDENLNLNISQADQPIFISWASNKSNTGVPEVGRTQAGTSTPAFFAFNIPPNVGAWTQVPPLPGNGGIYYAAVFCRGEAPRGACCFNQPEIPGADISCVDDVPVTSCLGSRWGLNSTCIENIFDPPCGTHACCPPDSSTRDLLFDDCREMCTLDENPITCFPVCDGGNNDGLECDPGLNGADCPDGFCDVDGRCPGSRTCGLTGCMLAGEFTGRPCDPNNPGAGTSDCMTCSTNGEYCRPRCIGGTRDGRICDPNDPIPCPGDAEADPVIVPGVCDPHFDCPGSQTCGVQGQTCVTDETQCSLRCARWFTGEHRDTFDCPSFTCFDAEGDCFEGEPEAQCFGRCNGDPTRPCRFNIECAPGLCINSDLDCPIGRGCAGSPFWVCDGRAGCDNLICCGEVCRDDPVCCESSEGQGYDFGCADFAIENCTNPPGNDDCWSQAPNEGAFEFELVDDDTALTCNTGSESCTAAKLANNANAKTSSDDPRVCCTESGVNGAVLGTIWFKFQAFHESAQIETCGTPGDPVARDSVIQVFEAGTVTPNGNDFDECNSLQVIGCNDDSGCGVTGEQASVCVTNLNVGSTYFVMMGSKRGENLGQYEIDIESPCPGNAFPEQGSICEDALVADVGQTPFDLTEASLDCPAELELPAMSNDVWYDLFVDFCDGPSVLTIQTCGFDLGEDNPDTTLAVYTGSDCPPFDLAASSDDATISPVCSVASPDGQGGSEFKSCEVDTDCNRGCNAQPHIACAIDDDCPGNDTCNTSLLGTCQTAPLGSGPSSLDDCTVDAQCTRGACAHNSTIECNVDTFAEKRCEDGTLCVNNLDCTDGSDCEPECGFEEGGPTPVECLAQEVCVPAVCESECAPASYVQVPTGFPGLNSFKIRIGGEFGSTPSGILRISCERDDCNDNGLPDLAEIDAGISPDCNLNGEPDECDITAGESGDCNCNDIPDECEILEERVVDCNAVGPPCDDGPFFCEGFDCDDDINDNGIPDCCDAGVPPLSCDDCPSAGACCTAGVCTEEFSVDCTGVYQGDGTTCDAGTCTIGSCCEAGGACRGGEVASECQGGGETFRPSVTCATPCVSCSIDDVTEAVFADADGIAADPFDRPGNCATDARQPHPVDNAAAVAGWDRLVLSFSCDPAPLGLGAGDFSISTTPAGPTPGIQSVGAGANSATVQLDGPISPERWTCIEHTASGTEWCAGYLPADASQNALSNASDSLALIDSLNAVAPLPNYATDINRSGVTNAQDLTRLIDLLNGAQEFDVWLGANIPACPSAP